jgi:hypothetical protein
MKQYTSLIIALVLVVVLAGGMTWRIHAQKKEFDKTVQTLLQTSEGYDQAFISMVNRLEEELARQASFGYTGKKDPMTGKVRTVVLPSRPSKKPGAPAASPADKDPMKLTAIIYDDVQKQFTAIVMDDERSFSVEVGDKVSDRRITRITDQVIYMESDSMRYKYDIFGGRASMKKGGEPLTP